MRLPKNMSTELDLSQAALVTRLKMPVKVAPKVETSHVT